MLTQNDFCDYDTCVALCELGMRVASRKVYKEKDAPLKSSSRGIVYTVRTASAHGYVIGIPLYEAQKWLREHRNIDVFPRKGYNRQNYQVEIYINYNRNIMLLDNDGEDYNSPEEALSEGIKEAVKILKENEYGRMYM